MHALDSTSPATPLDRVRRLSAVGIWVSTASIIVAAVALLYIGFWMILRDPFYETALIEDLAIDAYVDQLTLMQAIAGTTLWGAADLVAIAMLWTVRSLFQGFLNDGVFSVLSTTRLRRIGLLLLFLGPVSIISETLGGMLLTFWHTGDSVHGAISIDDGDIYAIVIGLVITAVSHIMLEAARLLEENQSFV